MDFCDDEWLVHFIKKKNKKEVYRNKFVTKKQLKTIN